MSLRRPGALDLLICGLALAILAAVAWISYSAGPGGYTGALRAVLLALAALAAGQTIIIGWLVLVSTHQHRQLAAVALRAARNASRRKSDIAHGEVTRAAGRLASAAHDLSEMLRDRSDDTALLQAIAAALNIEVVHPAPPPGAHEVCS